MVLNIHLYWLCYFVIDFTSTNAFIPHPLIADGAQSSDSITHAEITELAFIRSLARFFYDTRIRSNNNNGGRVNQEDYFAKEHTIDDLYELAHPEYNQVQVALYSLPLKFILDTVMIYNALVDFNASTKKLSAAHFDSEAFINGSRRILRLRQTIVNDTLDATKDLTNARQLTGQLLHTLQDFYSHSNWVEMGKTNINDLIGHNEIIGAVAGLTQATCTDNGCTKKTQKCTLWHRITLNKCPLVYYDCQNNIRSEINSQQLLTSGYVFNQFNEDNQPINKPANIDKCSHGSVLDDSSHIPAVGGINKDANNLLLSPHSNLHFRAVEFAVNATERFFNDLRRDVGDNNFDRLFAIHPTESQRQTASNSIANGQRFRLFTPLLSASLKENDSLFENLKNTIKNTVNTIKSMFSNVFSKDKLNIPTYDLSDLGVDVEDMNNFRTAPFIIGGKSTGRKKRLIDVLRQR